MKINVIYSECYGSTFLPQDKKIKKVIATFYLTILGFFYCFLFIYLFLHFFSVKEYKNK